jgi:hypothetical protein
VVLLLVGVAVLLVAGGVLRVRVERGDWVSASPFWRDEPGHASPPAALAIWVELARAVQAGGRQREHDPASDTAPRTGRVLPPVLRVA